MLSEIFFAEGLDSQLTDLPVGQISPVAQENFVRARKRTGTAFAAQLLWALIIFLKAEIATTR
jgi:hypothetical protein